MAAPFTRLCKRLRVLSITLVLGGSLAGPLAADGHPQRIIQSGHSLTDGIIAPLARMIASAGYGRDVVDRATIPGSPMDWRWKNATDPDIRQPDVMGEYDLLVITERVSLSGTLRWHASDTWALHWFEHAHEYGAQGQGAPTILYASWIDVTSGPQHPNPYNDPEGNVPFRDRLPLEQERWQYILDHVNANRPAGTPKMKMIPGPLIMAAAYDDITAGATPGLSDISDLFSDDIHVNDMGAYLIALAHFMVIYDADPRGLPHGVPSRGGPSKEQAAWMQDLVYRVVSDYQQTNGE